MPDHSLRPDAEQAVRYALEEDPDPKLREQGRARICDDEPEDWPCTDAHSITSHAETCVTNALDLLNDGKARQAAYALRRGRRLLDAAILILE